MQRPTVKGDKAFWKCDHLEGNQSKLESRECIPIKREKFFSSAVLTLFRCSDLSAVKLLRPQPMTLAAAPRRFPSFRELKKRFPIRSAQIELISSLHQWDAKIKSPSTMLTSRIQFHCARIERSSSQSILSLSLCTKSRFFEGWIPSRREFGVIERKNISLSGNNAICLPRQSARELKRSFRIRFSVLNEQLCDHLKVKTFDRVNERSTK